MRQNIGGYAHDIMVFHGDLVRIYEQTADEDTLSDLSTMFSSGDSVDAASSTGIEEISDGLTDECVFFQTQDISTPLRMWETDEVEEDLDSLVRQNWVSQRRARQILARTDFHGYPRLSAEVRAFERARGSWPDFIFVGPGMRGASPWRMSLDADFEMQSNSFVVRSREFLLPMIQHQLARIALVWPIPTPDEQEGADDIVLLVGSWNSNDECLLYATIWTWFQGNTYESAHLTISCYTTRQQILEALGLGPICESVAFTCLLQHQMIEMPHYVHWRGFQGMHLHVELHDRYRGEPLCDPHAFDHVAFMQGAIKKGQIKASVALLPGETWRWPIPYPPSSQYIRTGDIIRSQLRSILAGEHRGNICVSIGLGDPDQTANSVFFQKDLNDDSWTDAFAAVLSFFQIGEPVHFVVVAAQPPDDCYTLILAKRLYQRQQHYFFLVDFYGGSAQSQPERQVVTCPAPCLTHFVLRLYGVGADDGFSVYSYTPRERRRYMPEEKITDPTGTYLVVMPTDEDRLCLRSQENLLEDVTSLLSIQSTIREPVWLDPFVQLPPPGNPTWWFSKDFAKLDEIHQVGDHELVFDAPEIVDETARPWDKRRNDWNSDPGQKVTIRLADSLTPTHWCDIELPGAKKLLDSICAKHQPPLVPWNNIRRYLDEQHYRRFDELIMLQPDEYQEIKHIHIYTDGSFFREKSPQAGWAFAVFAESMEDTICLAVDFGVTETEPLQNGWVGAQQADSKAGEATALIRALEWALQYADLCFEAMDFHFDSQSVGYGADGFYGVDAEDVPMKIARCLTLTLRQCMKGHVGMNYVKAHAGHFHNDLVDAIARMAATEQMVHDEDDRPDYFSTATGQRAVVESLWLCAMPATSARATVYPTVRNFHIRLDMPGNETACQDGLPSALLSKKEEADTQWKSIRLNAVTYNVQSLGPRAGQGRTAYLREQLQSHGIEVAFLQETRTKHSSMTLSQSHIRLSSAAVNGQGGVEIWLLRHRNGSDSELFPKQEIKVLFSHPEVMLARVVYKSLHWLICTAHAPHSGHQPQVIHAFWKMLSTEMLKWIPKYPNFLIGIDANAHFAVGDDVAVGSYGLEDKENLSAQHFKDFLHQIGAYLPSTFQWIHEGTTTTWVSNVNGQEARCDYIVCPQQ